MTVGVGVDSNRESVGFGVDQAACRYHTVILYARATYARNEREVEGGMYSWIRTKFYVLLLAAI